MTRERAVSRAWQVSCTKTRRAPAEPKLVRPARPAAAILTESPAQAGAWTPSAACRTLHAGEGGGHMTEAEWLACDEPSAMLRFLEYRATLRKLRLFALACYRRVEDLAEVEACRVAAELAER